ncbi:hypothetical protein EON65_15040 [archaeon]|nr:MAG: hypothetical protein EON65_15040 [archaeon]
MGAPFAFDCRRDELRSLHLPCGDEDVTASFLRLVQPLNRAAPESALLLKYLLLGQMCVVLGDALFVHGAIHDHYLG